ncbi:MAG: hypothetical protein HY865_26915 [Chloroflexi bacterium]|nr:hypothetical protein [Chloroflexota bacterium]
MNISTLRILFAIFLIAHGLMTMSLATVPVPAQGALRTPYFPAWWRSNVDDAWPAMRIGLNPPLVRTVGWLLWLVILALFVAAGVGLLGLPGLAGIWQTLALIAAVLSLILLAFYWHPWLVVGVLLNIGIVGGVYLGWFTRWFAVK